MKFKKYPSILSIYDTKSITMIRKMGLDHREIEWQVSEKVHGANYSFYYDGEDIIPAKRTSFMDVSSHFYNHEAVFHLISPIVKHIYHGILHLKKGQELVVLGELFGGCYPHPEVDKVPNHKCVQKGVYYAPWNDFYAFDIKLDGVFLPQDAVNNILEETNILYAKPLFIGCFDEAIKYPNQFPTKIPQWLGLPDIKNTICEGIVIKPTIPVFFGNGKRVIFKSKNERFREEGKIERKENKMKQNNPYSVWAKEHITENRIISVISKVGNHKSQIGEILRELNHEVHNIYTGIEQLDKSEVNKLNRAVNKAAMPFILKHTTEFTDED